MPYVITLLGGKARLWGTAFGESGNRATTTYAFCRGDEESFLLVIYGAFCNSPVPSPLAGTAVTFHYSIDFCTFAVTAGESKEALPDFFLPPLLSQYIQDELRAT